MSVYSQFLVGIRVDALETRMKEYAAQVETLKEANAALIARLEQLERKSEEPASVEPSVESKKPRGRPRKHV